MADRFMFQMKEDDDEHAHQATTTTTTEDTKIELAHLVLPAAVHEGIQPGDGSEFILEASSDIFEIANGGEQAGTIEGVVDLDVVCGFVEGVTGEEFVDLLHHQDDEQVDEAPAMLDEETPLVSQQQQQQQRPRTESIALSADPFVETLSNTYPPQSPDSQGNRVTKLETTNNEAHEAFLISVPTTETSTNQHGEKLVLALPEIETKDDEAEMTFPDLVRKYSTLPTDIQSLELHATTTTTTLLPPLKPVTISEPPSKQQQPEEQIHLELVIERKVPVVGYGLLVSGLFALSSVGAAFDLQGGGVTPAMKCLWRLHATTLALFPLAVKSFKISEIEKLSFREIFVLFPICAFCYMFMSTSFVMALEMTSLANAFILSNLASLIIIFSKAVIGLPILLLEGWGASIGFGGALLCTAAPNVLEEASDDILSTPHSKVDATMPRESMGNWLAFSASVGMAAYLVIAKNLRSKVDLFVFMFSLFLFASIFLLVAMVLAGEPMSVSLHPVYGIFGWMTPVQDRLPLELYMAIVCNIIGTTGYIAVMKYFDPVVISMVMLTEPVIAAFLGVLVGVDQLPGMQVWIGDAIVCTGSVLVIYSGSRKKESIDATKSLMTPKVGARQPHTPLMTPNRMTTPTWKVLQSPPRESKKHKKRVSSGEPILIWE